MNFRISLSISPADFCKGRPWRPERWLDLTWVTLQMRSRSEMNTHSWLLLLDSLQCTDYFDLSWHLACDISPRPLSGFCALDSPQHKLLITFSLYSGEAVSASSCGCLPSGLSLSFPSSLPLLRAWTVNNGIKRDPPENSRDQHHSPSWDPGLGHRSLQKPTRSLEERKESGFCLSAEEIIGSEKGWRWRGR